MWKREWTSNKSTELTKIYIDTIYNIYVFADEDDASADGESGVTDDEGIEDDHEEGETGGGDDDNDKAEQQRGNMGKSGTCDTLISLCR